MGARGRGQVFYGGEVCIMQWRQTRRGYYLMINNNPYNIPERAQKPKKVVMETAPLFPHQINRSNEELEQKQRHQLHKRNQIPYFLESSVSQAPRVLMGQQPSPKPQLLQMSTVTQWDGRQNHCQAQPAADLNERLASITARLNDHDRKIGRLLETRKREQHATTNLSESTSFSIDNLSQNVSRQIERYHSTEDVMEKMRVEFSSYRSHSQKLGEHLRAEINGQRDTITQEIIMNFKESLQEKFDEEEIKIADYLSEFTENQKEKLDFKIEEVKKDMKRYWLDFSSSLSKKEDPTETKLMTEVKTLRSRLELNSASLQDFQSTYRNFKQQILDNILATQDHKRWLYEIDNFIGQIRSSMQSQLGKGCLKVSREYCIKEVLHLRYEEYLSIAEKASGISVKSLERTYLIDEQGYLLDSHQFYLVDQNDSKIRLTQSEIQKLKAEGLLK